MKSNRKYILLGILVLAFLIMSVVPVCGLSESSTNCPIFGLANSGSTEVTATHDTQWMYYREVTIKESSGTTLTNYQVLVELNPSNFPDKAKSDGSDLRFVEDGEELCYWIEDYDAGAKTAKIWVNVSIIPANGEAKIKMYYGNPSATSESSGDATFIFYDEIPNGDKWYFLGDPLGKVDYSVGNPAPSIKGNGDGRHSSGALSKQKFDYSNGLWLEADIKTESDLRCGIFALPTTDDYWNWIDGGVLRSVQVYLRAGETTKRGFYVRDVGGYAEDWYDTNWHKYAIAILPEGTVVFYVDGTHKWTSTGTINPSYNNHGILIIGHDPEYWFDNVKVRKYTTPEPTLSISEELSTQKEKPLSKYISSTHLEEFLCSQGYHNSTCPPKGDPPPNGSVKFWSLVPGGGISHSSVMLSYDRQIEMGHKRKPGGNKSEYISEILPPWENPKPLTRSYHLQKTLCPPPTYHSDNDCIENMKGIDRKYDTPEQWNCHGFSAHVVHNCVETGIRMKHITDFKWKGETLILNKGEVWGDVIPLTIQIPQGAVQFGSEYTIEVRNDNTTIIYLIKGKADYKGIGHSLSLSSGQMGVIDPTGTPLPPTTFNISEMDLWWTELNYEGKGSSVPIPKPLEIVKLFTAKSVYPRGEKVDVHYHIKNTGTEDVEEYHVEYDIIDVTGKTVYKNVGSAHSISAGDENKWHSEKWEIPSNAEYGPCTIEARLKWDSETDTETTDFFVTQATRAKDKTAALKITELYTSKFEYSRGEAIELCYRIKNVGTTNAEYHLCNIIEVEGEKGYWFILSTHSIAAGEEQKRCAAGCWKIPSDAKCGTYTIETTLVWDSKTVKKETTFIVK